MFPPQEASAPSVPEAAEGARRTPEFISDGDDDVSLLSVSEILDASSPVLKQYQPGRFSAATIKKWFQTFPTETQQPAMKIIQILNDSSVTKTELQLSLKMTPSTLHQIVAIGASLTAWLVRDHESMNVEALFSVIDIPRSALTHFVHYVPFISKGPAMWSLSILHVLLLARYSAPTLTTRQWRNRLKKSGVSPHMYTYPFFQSSYVVYVKMPFHPSDQKRGWYTQPGHFYIGSTAISAVKREFNRFANLKTNSAQPCSSCRTVNPLLEHQDRFWSYTWCIAFQACTPYNLRQCLGPWTLVN